MSRSALACLAAVALRIGPTGDKFNKRRLHPGAFSFGTRFVALRGEYQLQGLGFVVGGGAFGLDPLPYLRSRWSKPSSRVADFDARLVDCPDWEARQDASGGLCE